MAVAVAGLLLCGCGARTDKAASQVAARVNKDEITFHQVNFVLQQQRGLRPEQADAAGRQVLERLIDQQLALVKADELKLDRDPRVLQQLEAARREILARAYLEKIADGAAKPTAGEITKYYQDKPLLFRDRRIYSIQELAIEARPDQTEGLGRKLGEAKDIGEFVEYLKAEDFRFAGNQAVRAAEQLPPQILETLAGMKDGQRVLTATADRVQVLVLAASRSQPVSEEQVRPAIEQYLVNERRRKLADDDLKALRAAAKIEYLGKFAQGPKPTAADPGAVPQTAAAEPARAASAGLSPAEINKGLGLK